MRQMTENLMSVPAQRLASQLPREGAILVCGPREYLPFEAAHAALPSAEVITLPEDAARLAPCWPPGWTWSCSRPTRRP